MKPRRWSSPILLIANSVVTSLCLTGCQKEPERPPKVTLFHLGMTVEQALAKLPPGVALQSLGIEHNYSPNEPTPEQAEKDIVYILARPDQSPIGLYFSKNKKLVKIDERFREDEALRP